MTRLLSDDDFDRLCAAFTGTVLQRIADTNLGAAVILEKTPDHVRHAPFIFRLLPEAWFLHIIRDPRGVVSSLAAAAHAGARTGRRAASFTMLRSGVPM